MRHVGTSTLTGARRMVADPQTDWLTITEAAHLLKVSRVTLHRWLKDGRLPAYHVGPKAVRIRRSDLAAVMRPVRGKEVTSVTEATPAPIQTAIRPLTDEEVARGWAALKSSDEFVARLR